MKVKRLSLLVFACVLVGFAGSNPGFSQVHGFPGKSVQGPGTQPALFFACCDHGIVAADQLFSLPAVIPTLEKLHATLVVAVSDFSPERAQLVRRLNEAGIPLIAWVELPGEGTYVNAGNTEQSRAAFSEFEQWSQQNGLHWRGVGLDIEPNFQEFARLRGHPWTLARLLMRRYFDRSRVMRARDAYGHLIGDLRARGYFVQTYQLPFIVAERREHSTLLERLLGIVDVRGDQEALMVYTSYAPEVGAGMIWTLGPQAQALAVGVTEGDPTAGPRGVPLDWQDFSRDLIVAAHFSSTVGVYNLEGCVKQGFLDRLQTMDWGQTVLIPPTMVRRARWMSRAARGAIWVGTWLPAIFSVFIVLLAGTWFWWRRRRLVRLKAGAFE